MTPDQSDGELREQLTTSFGADLPGSVLLMLIARRRVGERPSRIEPRVVEGRSKLCKLLKHPRHTAPEIVRAQDHPIHVK